MRAFIVLCFIALAYADKLGYDYEPVQHSDSGLSFVPGGKGGNYAAVNDDDDYGSAGPSEFLGSSSHGHGSYSPGGSHGGSGGEWDKEFFLYTAPEDEVEDNGALQRALGSSKKKLRVVFIKNPENNALENAALALAKQAAEQKTAIYVLQKQHDIEDFANKLNAVRNEHQHKPEVHFVKYRTPEDASNAQRQIQSQYDSLGGTSHSHNGGIAPVLNFASKTPSRHHHIGGAASAPAPSSSYLPASILRRYRYRYRY